MAVIGALSSAHVKRIYFWMVSFPAHGSVLQGPVGDRGFSPPNRRMRLAGRGSSRNRALTDMGRSAATDVRRRPLCGGGIGRGRRRAREQRLRAACGIIATLARARRMRRSCGRDRDKETVASALVQSGRSRLQGSLNRYARDAVGTASAGRRCEAPAHCRAGSPDRLGTGKGRRGRSCAPCNPENCPS